MSTEKIEDLNILMQQRREKLAELEKNNIEAYGQKYNFTHYAAEIVERFEELEGEPASLSGRIMSMRTHGKASFADIMDMSGRIQLYVKIDEVGEEAYELFSSLDIGDIIGVSGSVFRTRRGQISINVKEFTLLSKSLRPLPEKWHGLKDKETRYRQRYVDLIVNPEVRKLLN